MTGTNVLPPNTSTQKAELTALTRKDQQVNIYTDSKYVFLVLTCTMQHFGKTPTDSK